MKRKIFIILILAIILITGIAIVFRLHQTTNNSNDGEKERTNLEIKREKLIKKLDEMQRQQAIEAFIENGTSDDEIENIIEKIGRIDGVDSVELKSKDEVLEELKKRFDNNKELLDTYVGNNNIFPNSLIISVNDINKIEKIVEKVSEFKNIETVMSKQKTIDEIHKNLDTLSEEDIDLIIESID